MSIDDVTTKLIEIHRQYQIDGGFADADKVTRKCKPLADLEGFESDFIPEIVRRLARELGQPLAKGTRVTNIYVEKGTKLSITEVARKFATKYAPKGVAV